MSQTVLCLCGIATPAILFFSFLFLGRTFAIQNISCRMASALIFEIPPDSGERTPGVVVMAPLPERCASLVPCRAPCPASQQTFETRSANVLSRERGGRCAMMGCVAALLCFALQAAWCEWHRLTKRRGVGQLLRGGGRAPARRGLLRVADLL